MSLSRVIIWCIIASAVWVMVDGLYSSYTNLTRNVELQSKMIMALHNKPSPNEEFARELARIYYRQSQLDSYTRQTLGSKALNQFKQYEREYIKLCLTELGELECRRQWMRTHVTELAKIFDEAESIPDLTPV